MESLFPHIALLVATGDDGRYKARWADGEPMADVLVSVLEAYNISTLSDATFNRFVNALIVAFEGGDPRDWLDQDEDNLLEEYRSEVLFVKMETGGDPGAGSIAIWRHRWKLLKAIYLRLDQEADRQYVLGLLQDVKIELKTLIQAWQTAQALKA